MNKGPIGWVVSAWHFVVDVALRWYHGRVGDLAASVTFWIVISLPALVLALLAVIGPLDRLVSSVQFQGRIESEVEEFIARIFTDDSQGISRSITDLFSENNNSLAIVSLALAVWSISRGFSGLIRALEDIYGIEDRRPWYHTRVVAVVLGFGSILISVPLVLLEIYVWGSINDGLVESTLRGVVAIIVLILWASIVYHYGPAERHRWRFDLPGAVVAAFLWWLLSFGFARYVDLTSNANEVRAAVGAGLLALTWIWLAAQGLLIGGAVNYILGERLGVSRGRRSWTINEVVTKSTGEIRKIVVPDRDETLPHPMGTPSPTASSRINGDSGRVGRVGRVGRTSRNGEPVVREPGGPMPGRVDADRQDPDSPAGDRPATDRPAGGRPAGDQPAGDRHDPTPQGPGPRQPSASWPSGDGGAT